MVCIGSTLACAVKSCATQRRHRTGDGLLLRRMDLPNAAFSAIADKTTAFSEKNAAM
jgi:hypothetical protein